jgi:outer membrane protein OmpA-like peptidoglycan-associated protein
MSLDNDQTVDTWRGQVSMTAAGAGRVKALQPIVFGYLEVSPRTSVKGVARQLKNASEVVVVGHSAILTGQNPWNEHLSRVRAENVKNLLRKEGVRAKITVRGLGGTAPLSRVLTETRQAPNRRVMVYVVPKSS